MSLEIGICQYCNCTTHINRKYYHYDIKCDCHSPSHFEVVFHCKNCTPIPPKKTTISIEPFDTLNQK